MLSAISRGLKVMDVYDNGNNDWLAMNNNSNEWAVAYHGIGKAGNTTDTETKTNNIIKTIDLPISGFSKKLTNVEKTNGYWYYWN